MIRLAQGKKPLDDDDMPDDMVPLPGNGDNMQDGNNFMNNAGGGNFMGGRGPANDPFKAIQMYNENAYKNWDQNILE